ncbi:hypothetical protein DENSPDRAFT_787929, partial [Dentipellis sp. KUC8613]
MGFTNKKRKVAVRRNAPRKAVKGKYSVKTFELLPLPRPSIELRGIEIKPTDLHKFLGLYFDQALKFLEHAAHALEKGTKWVEQFRRVAKPSTGIAGKHMRCFYISAVIPKILYGASIFLIPPSSGMRGSKTIITKLGRIQRIAGLYITAAMRSTANEIVDAHADLLPFSLLVDKLCHAEAIRIATLPATHPLHAHAQATA